MMKNLGKRIMSLKKLRRGNGEDKGKENLPYLCPFSHLKKKGKGKEFFPIHYLPHSPSQIFQTHHSLSEFFQYFHNSSLS